VTPAPAPDPAAPAPNAAPDPASPETREIAAAQRQLLFAVVSSILLNLTQCLSGTMQSSPVLFVPLFVVALAILAFMIVSVVRLAAAMGTGTATRVLLALAMFIPLVNLLVLLVLNGRATRRLEAAGLKVGLMGAK